MLSSGVCDHGKDGTTTGRGSEDNGNKKLACGGQRRDGMGAELSWKVRFTSDLSSSEISPTRCNNCVFILRNGFTLHVSDDNLTHHQEYICCVWPQVSRLT